MPPPVKPPGEAILPGCEWGSHGAPIAPGEKTSSGDCSGSAQGWFVKPASGLDSEAGSARSEVR